MPRPITFESDDILIVAHHAYCGMTVPHGEYDTLPSARVKIAAILRRRRRQGFPIAVLTRGREWEVQEPDGALMVPDQCGILTLAVKHRPHACGECGTRYYDRQAAADCCTVQDVYDEMYNDD